MSNKLQPGSIPGTVKMFMYLSEIFVVILLFGIFFKSSLTPFSTSLSDVSALFGWMATMVVMCYIIGVWLRPIAFFYRGSRAGSIVGNVTIAVFYMAAFFLVFVSLVGRLDMFRDANARNVFALWRLMAMFLCIGGILIVWRFICRAAIRYLRSNGKNVHRVAFVGGGDNIWELFNEMRNPFYGYQVIGYFNYEPLDDAPEGLKYLGSVSDVTAYLSTDGVHQLYCSLPSAMAADIRPLINFCEHHCIRFFSVPNVRNYLKRQMNLEMLGSVPVLYIREDPLSSTGNRLIKRAFDVIVSGLFMIPFCLIILPIVAIISKITQPGPIFFRQQRNGLNGDVFYCYKFRSMKVNVDADRKQTTEDDPRKTKFGNFLRKSSIDEMPQFINVLKGDMSIVGPRPHMLLHTEEYSALIDKYMVRHWVRPGITGWAQVTGARGETKELWQMEERIKKDIWYIEHWSIWLDLRIIFLTVWNAIGGDKQAY